AAAGVGLVGDLLSASAIEAPAAAHAVTQIQVSGIGECSMVSTTPRNTKLGGAATPSSATCRARRCATVGQSTAASDMAASRAKIGTAKASVSVVAIDSHASKPPLPDRTAETLAVKPSNKKGYARAKIGASNSAARVRSQSARVDPSWRLAIVTRRVIAILARRASIGIGQLSVS